MGYEELVEAREKRAEKEAAWKVRGKGKRGRKRTSAAPEADAEKPKTKATRVTKKSKSATNDECSGTDGRDSRSTSRGCTCVMDSPRGADVLVDGTRLCVEHEVESVLA
jgi:hypothetical protein